jgi:hypothetical protein
MTTVFEAEIAFARGESTVDQILTGINDGTIYIPRPRPPANPNSPYWYEEVESQSSLAPFYRLVRYTEKPDGDTRQYLTPEQYEQIREAIAAKTGSVYIPLPDSTMIEALKPPAPAPDADDATPEA